MVFIQRCVNSCIPMGGCALFAYEADSVLAQAAQQAQHPFILSAVSSVPLETIMQQAPQSWYQAYLPGDTTVIAPLLGCPSCAALERHIYRQAVQVCNALESWESNPFGPIKAVF